MSKRHLADVVHTDPVVQATIFGKTCSRERSEERVRSRVAYWAEHGVGCDPVAVDRRLRYTEGVAIVVKRLGRAPRTWKMDARTLESASARVWRREGAWALRDAMRAFDLNRAEAGRLFGISRQAIGKWLNGGVPPARIADVERVAHLADELMQTFRRERLPQIVRAPLPALGGHSVLDALREHGPGPVLELIARLRSWVPAA